MIDDILEKIDVSQLYIFRIRQTAHENLHSDIGNDYYGIVEIPYVGVFQGFVRQRKGASKDIERKSRDAMSEAVKQKNARVLPVRIFGKTGNNILECYPYVNNLGLDDLINEFKIEETRQFFDSNILYLAMVTKKYPNGIVDVVARDSTGKVIEGTVVPTSPKKNPSKSSRFINKIYLEKIHENLKIGSRILVRRKGRSNGKQIFAPVLDICSDYDAYATKGIPLDDSNSLYTKIVHTKEEDFILNLYASYSSERNKKNTVAFVRRHDQSCKGKLSPVLLKDESGFYDMPGHIIKCAKIVDDSQKEDLITAIPWFRYDKAMFGR